MAIANCVKKLIQVTWHCPGRLCTNNNPQENVMILDALTLSGMILVALLIAALLVGRSVDKPEK